MRAAPPAIAPHITFIAVSSISYAPISIMGLTAGKDAQAVARDFHVASRDAVDAADMTAGIRITMPRALRAREARASPAMTFSYEAR